MDMFMADLKTNCRGAIMRKKLRGVLSVFLIFAVFLSSLPGSYFSVQKNSVSALEDPESEIVVAEDPGSGPDIDIVSVEPETEVNVEEIARALGYEYSDPGMSPLSSDEDPEGSGEPESGATGQDSPEPGSGELGLKESDTTEPETTEPGSAEQGTADRETTEPGRPEAGVPG